jgi:hypothetical protein
VFVGESSSAGAGSGSSFVGDSSDANAGRGAFEDKGDGKRG